MLNMMAVLNMTAAHVERVLMGPLRRESLRTAGMNAHNRSSERFPSERLQRLCEKQFAAIKSD
jgi:hypothetical protein